MSHASGASNESSRYPRHGSGRLALVERHRASRCSANGIWTRVLDAGHRTQAMHTLRSSTTAAEPNRDRPTSVRIRN